MNISEMLTSFGSKLPKTKLLLVGAVVGVGATAYLATVDARKAADILAANADKDWDLKQKVRASWRCYIPTASVGATTVGFILALNGFHSRKLESAGTALTISQNMLGAYQKAAPEVLGKAKSETLAQEVMTRVMELPPEESAITRIGLGETLCYETCSGRYFYADQEILRQLINDFNHTLLGSGWMTLNDFYGTLELPPIKIGDDLGWEPTTLVEPSFTSLLTSDGRPALVLDYATMPTLYPYR